MAATPSVKLTFQTTYRGGTKNWSNRCHFSGGVPADLTAWEALISAIMSPYNSAMVPATEFIEATCYLAGSDLPLHTIPYSTTGGFTVGSDIHMPLECTALERWSTDQRSVKNHPIYLFNYMHGVLRASASSDYELLASDQKSAIQTYVTAWVTGFSDGTNTYKRAGPNGAVAQSGTVGTYIGHRDFPT